MIADTIETNAGTLTISFPGHASLIFQIGTFWIYVDPWSRMVDLSKSTKANIILITHHHDDHFDKEAITQLRCPYTLIYANARSATAIEDAKILKNGDKIVLQQIEISAIPAYNLENNMPNGIPFHPKGDGNGYLLLIGGTRIYIAGDTEPIPEMSDLKNIDIAFLPMNTPYTMTPKMFVDAVSLFYPKITYPYHTEKEEVDKLLKIFKAGITELRIRKMPSQYDLKTGKYSK